MRIAFVSEHASPLATVGGVDSGGQNVHVAELARALGAQGHQVTVYTRRDGTSLRDRVRMCRGVTVEHVPAGPPAALPKDRLLPYMSRFGRYLAARWLREPPDVVHAHFWMSGLAALAGARGHGLPVVQTFHSLGVVKRRHQGARDASPESRIRMEVAIARDVAAVLATSSDEERELARLGVPAHGITVVPCGVDVSMFRPDGPAARRGPAPRVLAASRLVKRKGLDTVVRAMPGVPGAELVIAGGPPAGRLRGDPEYRRLSRLAAELGVGDRVSFHGRVGHHDMPALIRSADLGGQRPLVRAVRHGAAGGDGLRRAHGGLRCRRSHRHRAGRRHRHARPAPRPGRPGPRRVRTAGPRGPVPLRDRRRARPGPVLLAADRPGDGLGLRASPPPWRRGARSGGPRRPAHRPAQDRPANRCGPIVSRMTGLPTKDQPDDRPAYEAGPLTKPARLRGKCHE